MKNKNIIKIILIIFIFVVILEYITYKNMVEDKNLKIVLQALVESKRGHDEAVNLHK